MTMFKIVGNDYTYIYNVSWEDPRIDHTVLKCTKDDHVITIASAGCNAFDYLIEGARVTAVDFNGAQIALTEAKAACCQHIEFEEFFQIFAKNDIDLFRRKYFEVIRSHLSMPSQRFWDSHIKSLKSVLYSGTSGFLAWLICRVIFRFLGLGFIRRTVVEEQSLDALQSECKKHQRRLKVFCWVVDKLISNLGGAMLAGVPSRQLELGLHRTDNFQTVFKRICSTDLVHDNYFYYGYIAGEYSETCCPQYLKRDNFYKLREALNAGRLSLFEGTLVDVCKKAVYTVASLLDHMDWMPPFMINEEMYWLQQRMDPKRGRVFWRSFSEGVHSAPLVWLKPMKVDDTGDRVAMYWSTWMAKMDGSIRFDLRTRNWPTTQTKPQGFFSQLSTGIKIVTFPLMKGMIARRVAQKHNIAEHASKMEAFYESQKDEYDAFRENFLHARSWLADCIPLKEQKMVWIDVGGGTGRNLEFFSVKTIRERFSKIYVVDVSLSLLEVAQRRVEAAGLKDIVECVFCDFTDKKMVAEKLPLHGKCDLVTFSYSLSMIPDKVGALDTAAELLKPKGEGILGVADFYYGGGRRASRGKGDKDGITNILTRIYCEATRLWFKQDGVILLKQDVFDAMRFKFDFDAVPDEKFRRRVPLLPILRPWHGVVMAPTR
ncbi:hypothetical protein GUITHDRAFT_97763 [Guillardia theta CCMP2712]|uniref:Methyltransferase domain-containing protein n=1 Tax=Guillardia theta (strain CCMP2712) TaxID=905079 RepID=L1IIH3_GUITC|nr:hypothetical protein GUITHDRAFT_97763 [Guillardia theta CCMP2712]EKX35615.1 hypothetical protein GUITHDRAFT_97763 [Guillardia theta CCMP2712]|eukprot:XP_005822595.1 hypothetical protein GUITHDRAFT_97763 [Guillardia theta CCMP2712]